MYTKNKELNINLEIGVRVFRKFNLIWNAFTIAKI